MKLQAEPSLAKRKDLRDGWHKRHCLEYTKGDCMPANRTDMLMYVIGFHSGDDTAYFLERGHDVISVDANPAMINDGLTHPLIRLTHTQGRLKAIARGLIRQVAHSNESLTFYLHRKITEWSTFNRPSADKMSSFDTIMVPVCTCGELIRRYGKPYYYIKVHIEGFDEACLASLEVGRLPAYVSTEDPLRLGHLLSLGYRSFKMVSQAVARRGAHQFSGGMPEEANRQ